MRAAHWLALTALAAVCLLFYAFWIGNGTPSKGEIEESGQKARTVPVAKKETSANTSKVSDEEWDEILELANGAKAPQSFQLEKLVHPGEKIITQAYEGRPGEFVITEMVPTVRSVNGKQTLFVSIQSLSITPSSANTITAAEIELPPRTTYARVTRINDAKFDVTIKGQIEGDKVRIKASGDYEKRPPMVPPK